MSNGSKVSFLREELPHRSISVDEVLTEVPLRLGTGGFKKKGIHFTSLLAHDVDFCKQWEVDSIALCKLSDLCYCTRLLVTKLVAREGKHGKSLVSKVFLQCYQLSVVEVCIATLAGYIHH